MIYDFGFTSVFARVTPSGVTTPYTWNGYKYSSSDFEFNTNSNGYVLLDDSIQKSYVFKTADFGNNWNQILVDSANQFTSMSFPDSLNGYVSATNGVMYKTIDAGVSWQQLNVPTLKNINSIVKKH